LGLATTFFTCRSRLEAPGHIFYDAAHRICFDGGRVTEDWLAVIVGLFLAGLVALNMLTRVPW